MPRLPLLAVLGAALVAATGAAQDSHTRPGVLLRSCTPCHHSHGVPGSPLLRQTGDDMCLTCHGPGASTDSGRSRLGIGAGARPADVASELTKASVHSGARCLECHSVHGATARVVGLDTDISMMASKPSPKRGWDREADLCLSCHGSRGVYGGDPHDLAARLSPSNPSYHPILAPGPATDVPSLVAPLTTTSTIDCTDCHTNDDPTGPRGPHGSSVRGLLGGGYNRDDGQAEAPTAYSLCYSCHQRGVVLGQDAFTAHREHVVEERTPCSLCHDPHGTTSARALIRFNEPTAIVGVTASSSGRLEYLSDAPGSGLCYLTCHGKDHDPLGYGSVPAEVIELGKGTRSPRTRLRSGAAPAPGAPPPRLIEPRRPPIPPGR